MKKETPQPKGLKAWIQTPAISNENDKVLHLEMYKRPGPIGLKRRRQRQKKHSRSKKLLGIIKAYKMGYPRPGWRGPDRLGQLTKVGNDRKVEPQKR